MSTIADTTSGSPTFAVTVTLDLDEVAAERHPAADLPAAVTLTTGAATGVVTVPRTALTATGGTAMVLVVDDEEVVATRVTLGVVGPTTAEVTDGLDEGATVVLADLDAALPGAESTGTTTPQGPGSAPGGGPGMPGAGGGFAGR